MRPRVYCSSAGSHSEISLDAPKSHHLKTVLRCLVGDLVEVFDGQGNTFSATIKSNSKKIILSLGEGSKSCASPIQISIGQGLCASSKMDWVVEKLTELGANHLIPISSFHSKKKIDFHHQQRWQRLTISACEQCGRNTLLSISQLQSLTTWVDSEERMERRLLLCPQAKLSLMDVLKTTPLLSAYRLLAGPESGFSETERKLVITAGFTPVHLGPYTLRTETAAMVALATLQQWIFSDKPLKN